MPVTVIRVLGNKLISKLTILLDLYIFLERNAFLILDQTHEGYSDSNLYSERDQYQKAIQELEAEIVQTQGLIQTVLHKDYEIQELQAYLPEEGYERLLKICFEIEACKRAIAGLDLETYLLVDNRKETIQKRQSLSTQIISASNAYKSWIKHE